MRRTNPCMPMHNLRGFITYNKQPTNKNFHVHFLNHVQDLHSRHRLSVMVSFYTNSKFDSIIETLPSRLICWHNNMDLSTCIICYYVGRFEVNFVEHVTMTCLVMKCHGNLFDYGCELLNTTQMWVVLYFDWLTF